jgi:hypothetical protein
MSTNPAPGGLLGGFWQRRDSGLYGEIEKNLKGMGNGFLGSATLGRDYTRSKSWDENEIFTVPGSKREYPFTIIGETVHSGHGHAVGAAGNHSFHSKSGAVSLEVTAFRLTQFTNPQTKFMPLTDSSRVKDRIVIGVPTHATPLLSIMFNNQLATLDDIRGPDEAAEKAAKKVCDLFYPAQLVFITPLPGSSRPRMDEINNRRRWRGCVRRSHPC